MSNYAIDKARRMDPAIARLILSVTESRAAVYGRRTQHR